MSRPPFVGVFEWRRYSSVRPRHSDSRVAQSQNFYVLVSAFPGKGTPQSAPGLMRTGRGLQAAGLRKGLEQVPPQNWRTSVAMDQVSRLDVLGHRGIDGNGRKPAPLPGSGPCVSQGWTHRYQGGDDLTARRKR